MTTWKEILIHKKNTAKGEQLTSSRQAKVHDDRTNWKDFQVLFTKLYMVVEGRWTQVQMKALAARTANSTDQEQLLM